MQFEANGQGEASAAISGDIARYGVSTELLGMLATIRETPGLTGPKFRSRDVDALARGLFCRNYGFRCLELAYLLYAVVNGYQQAPAAKVLCFFWVDEVVTPAKLRAAFDQIDHESIALTEAGLEVHADGERFCINPSRVGELAVWLEFLVNLDPGLLETAESALQRGDVTSIKALASDLQRQLYGYLAEHTQPSQQLRRLRFLWQWLAESGVSAVASSITDDLIIAFWRFAATEEDDGLGFRRYRSVVEDFIALHDAFEVGQTLLQLEGARGIGADSEAYEVSPDLLEQALEPIDKKNRDFAFLAESPKFLPAKLLEQFDPILNCQLSSRSLPLTALRSACFGKWQARLIQAARNRKGMAELLAAGPDTTYALYGDSVEESRGPIAQAKLSGLHVLITMQVPEALPVLMDFLDNSAQTALLAELGGGDDDTSSNSFWSGEVGQYDEAVASDQLLFSLGSRFHSELSALRLKMPELNALLQSAKSAFTANNREGFRMVPSGEFAGGYLRGIDALAQLSMTLDEFLAEASGSGSHGTGVAANYGSDLSIFSEVFNNLYGGEA